MHPEALTDEQREVLLASASVTQRWGAYLAGGAALAIHLGHRRSVDLDWFTRQTLSPTSLTQDLQSLGYPVRVKQNREGTFLGHVAGVQYSVFRYPYELVARADNWEGCALASLPDIAAMKMSAIVSRATKRDYVDLYFLFQKGGVSVTSVLATMSRKFPGLDSSLAIRALTYFDDVDKAAMPEMIAKTSWEDMKRGLRRVIDRQRSGISR